jgi:general nucleoside transport system permease protein
MSTKPTDTRYRFGKRILDLLSAGNLNITLISILMGLLFGSIILIIGGFNPFEAYSIMWTGVFGRTSYIAQTIVRSTPIILTGLSVAFAFRTGLFNIGAEGQFIIGAMVAALTGYFFQLPAIIHVPVVFFSAILAAGLWGSIAGILKSRFGVHEVISTIMLNWIALYLQNYVIFRPSFRRPNSEASHFIRQTATIGINLPQSLIGSARVHWGIIMALIIALLVWFILKKTTLGYQLRAVGLNRHAAEYGGIHVRKNMIISMAIAGALAGSAGAFHVMGVSRQIAILPSMEGYGFNGIAVALIGANSAIGCVLAGLLFGALTYGGPKIQSAMGAPSEIISIMIGTIVLFISMPAIIKHMGKKFKIKRGDKDV